MSNNINKETMKKLAFTIAIVLGLGLCSYAQSGGGLFGYGDDQKDAEDDEFVMAWYALGNDQEIDNSLFGLLRTTNGTPKLPDHNQDDNVSPLGSGALLLIGFGAAYALKKRKK